MQISSPPRPTDTKLEGGAQPVFSSPGGESDALSSLSITGLKDENFSDLQTKAVP